MPVLSKGKHKWHGTLTILDYSANPIVPSQEMINKLSISYTIHGMRNKAMFPQAPPKLVVSISKPKE